MNPFQTLHTVSGDLNRVQDNVRNAVDPLLKAPIVDGVLVEDISLTSGQVNLVSHGLGKKPRIVIVVRQSANAVVWEDVSSATTKLLSVHASANCTVSLWVS